MKRKILTGVVFAMILTLAAITTLAGALMSAVEIVETRAVPMAQNNEQENYSYEELAELIQELNDNGITLDEGSRVMKAFESRHGFWEEDTIREICRTVFGKDELWTREQCYWYGEMLVAAGAWAKNAYILPGEDELSEQDARIHAVQILKEKYDVDLPIESNDFWSISSSLGFIYNESAGESLPSWDLDFIPSAGEDESVGYTIAFDLKGENVQSDFLVIAQKKKEPNEVVKRMLEKLHAAWAKEKESISQYGENMHFWPDEVKVATYGEPYAVPAQGELDHALAYAETFICKHYGVNALEKLGNFHVGYLFEYLENDEINATQLRWDIMLTTDPEFLSDGYRVQFQIIRWHETGEEEVLDLVISRANYGMGW